MTTSTRPPSVSYDALPSSTALRTLPQLPPSLHALTTAALPAAAAVEGLNFTLGEEYHVVHHQYAGAHWSRHEELYLKHMQAYKECVPTAFYKENVGFIFGYMITQDYAKLAECYYKPLWKDGMTTEELQAILKTRLQSHGPDLARRVGRTHRAKSLSTTDGKEVGDVKKSK